MRIAALIVFATVALAGAKTASPQTASPQTANPVQLEATAAFEQAYAASFYTFDACGDGVAGQLYRKALIARFAQCPFTAASRDRFRQRTALQRRRSSTLIRQGIEQNGGLPPRLEGMSLTCHEQRTSAEYRSFRDRLERFAAGTAAAETVIPEPCGADTISPYSR
jgi:hypothetical protein